LQGFCNGLWEAMVPRSCLHNWAPKLPNPLDWYTSKLFFPTIHTPWRYALIAFSWYLEVLL
jgi:hypothetical protein